MAEQLPAVLSPKSPIAQWLDRPETRQKLVDRLPAKEKDLLWYLARVSDAYRKNPELYECTEESQQMAILTLAKFRLDPSAMLNSACIVPYKNSRGEKIATAQFMYNGLRDLVMRTGEFLSVEAQVVYVAEEKAGIVKIDLASGQVEHPVRFEYRKGTVAGVYVRAVPVDGKARVEVMEISEIQRARKDTPAWKTWPEEMYRKVCLKRACKHLPISAEKRDELAEAIELDNEAEEKLAGAIDIPFSPVNEPGPDGTIARMHVARPKEAPAPPQAEPGPVSSEPFPPEAPEQGAAPEPEAASPKPPKKKTMQIKPKFDPQICGGYKTCVCWADQNGEIVLTNPCNYDLCPRMQ